MPGEQSDVEALAIEAGKLWWIKPGRDGFNEGKLLSCDRPTTDNELLRCLPNGCLGGAQVFVPGPLDSPHTIVGDPNFIYWAEKTAVWRLAK